MKQVGRADGRLSLHPLATAYPIGRLCAIREPSPAEAAAPPHNPQNSADSKNPAAPIYGVWVRVLFGGSKWNRALPGAHTSVGVWGSGRRGRQPLAAAYPIGRLCAIREPPPAEAAAPPYNPQRILRIRRTQPLQFMAAGFVCYSAAAGGTGHCPARKLRWGSGGAVGRADGHLLPRILSSGYALFESLPQPESLRGVSKAEFGSSNLWLPNSSIESAAAGGCRLSLPAP